MVSILWITGAVLLGMHGLIHLMGFFAYWPLALIPDLTYKTTILAGQVDLGAIGMRAYSILWLIPALGFIAVATAIILRWARWQQVFIAMTLISIVVTLLDWSVAFRGTLLDFVILIVFVAATQKSRIVAARGR